MDTSRLKKFAQYARRSLIEQVRSKLNLVLAEESEPRREYPKAVAELEKKLAEQGAAGEGEQQLIEQVAYTWFNRFCALRFMDVNQYNRIMVISPLAGQFQPEILAEAKAGHIDEDVVNKATREKIFGLLSGSIASRDGQSEAFRLLIVAVCNDLHNIMPYLFERIEDYTELLMPDDLLSGNSILAYTREAMTPEACESVESIGWLYQFYISEKKDEVFDGLKKNKKITPENIPAATQLFTPHWIVRYLVENSLGRLWMLNNPSSKLIEKMDYYIKPVEEERDFLKISSPEEIKVCDPACGSGHMLTYAYDLLYAIYFSTGDYDDSAIPGLILTNNLYGIEIDERAAELAAFALTMKAIKGDPLGEGNNRRRFFRNPVEPNIYRLEKISFTEEELDSYIAFAGKDLFTQDLRETLKEFEDADNFGSLIQPTLKTPSHALGSLETKDVSGQLFLAETHKSVLKVLNQAEYLATKYHVVVANPPYMGGKGMNSRLTKWAKNSYPTAKYDLYSMFIERSIELVVANGCAAMISMHSWMFLSSFEKFRKKLLGKCTFSSMAHIGPRGFDTIGGEVVQTTAFVLNKYERSDQKGEFIRLVSGTSEKEKSDDLVSAINDPLCEWRYHSSTNDFKVVPGFPIAYWPSKSLRNVFISAQKLSDIASPSAGLQTSDNARFLRSWFEVSEDKIGFGFGSREDAKESGLKWFPCTKGGTFRRWYGNNEFLVNWENDGAELFEFAASLYGSPTRIIKNANRYFEGGLTWSSIASAFSMRISPPGYIFETKGSMCFVNDPKDEIPLLALSNSRVIEYVLGIFSPTLDFHEGPLGKVPVVFPESRDEIIEIAKRAVEIAKFDWDSSELSWDFNGSPLKVYFGKNRDIRACYKELRLAWQSDVEELGDLEYRNNEAFIDAYGIEVEQDSRPSLDEIALLSNPGYRYKNAGSVVELELLLLTDSIKDFISYSVGCMFGRYSINKEGLMLANQGCTLEEHLKIVPQPTFAPDDDNVIPLIDFDGDWFEDDINERFKQFLKVTFGEENFAENTVFIEEAIGKDIKKFFLKDFYTDHVKRYKKRPIYWMFSSPKGTFNALIYMHRYNKDTVSIVLNDYLREFRTKLQARKESHEQIEVSASASAKEKTQAIQAIQKINKVLDEINDYEHETLYPLAGKPPEIDLDNGVKHNYPLFGKALKKVTGLS